MVYPYYVGTCRYFGSAPVLATDRVAVAAAAVETYAALPGMRRTTSCPQTSCLPAENLLMADALPLEQRYPLPEILFIESGCFNQLLAVDHLYMA